MTKCSSCGFDKKAIRKRVNFILAKLGKMKKITWVDRCCTFLICEELLEKWLK